MTSGSGSQPVEIVIRLQLELPPGMTLVPVVPADEPLAYRIPVLAEKLGVGRSKLAELVARGDIDSVKVDGARLVPADAVTAYLARLRSNGDAA